MLTEFHVDHPRWPSTPYSSPYSILSNEFSIWNTSSKTAITGNDTTQTSTAIPSLHVRHFEISNCPSPSTQQPWRFSARNWNTLRLSRFTATTISKRKIGLLAYPTGHSQSWRASNCLSATSLDIGWIGNGRLWGQAQSVSHVKLVTLTFNLVTFPGDDLTILAMSRLNICTSVLTSNVLSNRV